VKPSVPGGLRPPTKECSAEQRGSDAAHYATLHAYSERQASGLPMQSFAMQLFPLSFMLRRSLVGNPEGLQAKATRGHVGPHKR
jgi:hypothetical protein